MVDHPRTDHTSQTQAQTPERKHEGSDANIRGILLTAAGLVALIVFSVVGLYFYARGLFKGDPRGSVAPPPVVRGEPLPPTPRVEANQALDREEMLAHEREVLDSYGWVNEQQRIARIPISRAMELLLENPPPARNADQADNEKQNR